ncbi:MAG: hypothetical protein OES47_07985, partial [Acidobacteriota bacterium]|nr:hypothetical protein [Acidobacteriota bacterium]
MGMSPGSSLKRFQYVVQRAGRNLLPDGAASLARRLLGDIAGGESHAPVVFAEHYVESLARAGRLLTGAEVLLFGQG